MKLTYDRSHNIAYISFKDGVSEVESVSVGDDVTVDLAPDGTVVGIELLNANEQLSGSAPNRFLFVDEVSGQVSELPLPA
jgi:uncharacterized protein YuzE